ncbi:MAG: SHOCT domain-containing protein [Candidatus Parvarchaeota archaeon]|nr:SHOCT domain-containing protein [Candidatus Parvarchaeum tengchongense]MCW1295267.1 SHOCT domain-containing protein [Candidatus Parvarchaeum tengchongense]MCW1299424.1 SHOCT domain-containing protein [Candidatus Parvarchaeum tengchongense]MCW1311930.1 SHOCT domain-containing protein [Candidatus Parvarchaeum tengchongense]
MVNKTQKTDNSSNLQDFDLFGPLFHVVFRFLLIVVLIAAFFAAILAIISFPFNYTHNVFWNVFGVLLGVLFILWIVGYFLPVRLGHYRRYHRWYNYQNAEEVLKIRYAKGEISKKEFEEKIKELMKYH